MLFSLTHYPGNLSCEALLFTQNSCLRKIALFMKPENYLFRLATATTLRLGTIDGSGAARVCNTAQHRKGNLTGPPVKRSFCTPRPARCCARSSFYPIARGQVKGAVLAEWGVKPRRCVLFNVPILSLCFLSFYLPVAMSELLYWCVKGARCVQGVWDIPPPKHFVLHILSFRFSISCCEVPHNRKLSHVSCLFLNYFSLRHF